MDPSNYASTYVIHSVVDLGLISDFNCKSPNDIKKALHARHGCVLTRRALSHDGISYMGFHWSTL